MVAFGLEAFGIKGDKIVVFGLKSEDLGSDVLNGMQQFAIARKKEGRIGTAEFDLNARKGCRSC